MSRLVIHLGSLALLELPLREGETRLGRARGSDVVLPLPEVADHHAAILRKGQTATLRAIDSETVLLNGRRVSAAELSPGDEIVLGGYRLRWQIGDHAASGSHQTAPIVLQTAAPGAEVARVRVGSGRDAGLEIPFEAASILVGRAPDCDLVLSDETVSWRHCSLERHAGGVRIRDLGSRNGTTLESGRIETVMAQSGAWLRAGRTTLHLLPAGSGDSGVVLSKEGDRDGAVAGLAEMVGRSGAMKHVYARVREASVSQLPVLIMGETGTGKELAARAIHALGPRASGPFVPVNCAALPRDLMESELFGHARGAFTGAAQDRSGAFDSADGGTIFLDEVSEMPLDLQAKLLRVIEDGVVPRVGGGGGRRHFRVLAASNRNLEVEAQASRFRRDLYFRLAALPIRIPPLSDRLEDLSDLIRSFLPMADEQTGVVGASISRFSEEAFTPMREYSWPGNVRELRNLILSAAARRPAGTVDRPLIEELLSERAGPGRVDASAPRTLELIERDAIRHALKDSNGQRRAAARRLGIAESTLYEKIRRYEL